MTMASEHQSGLAANIDLGLAAISGKQRQTAADKITINKWQPTVADNDKLRPDNITINNGWWLAVADSDNLRQTRLPSEQMVANSG